MGACHRAWQFLHTVTARPSPEQVARARAHLPKPLQPLFERLPQHELTHALDVYERLLAEGHADPDLLAAGLLHDVGKTRAPLRLWERVLIVLTQAVRPRLLLRWGEGDPHGWRRPFVTTRQHPQWGAQMVAEAGGSQRLVDLVSKHQVQMREGGPCHEDGLLRALQRADSGN
jgi:putative nucleotidyltransferase with HDIG domain